MMNEYHQIQLKISDDLVELHDRLNNVVVLFTDIEARWLRDRLCEAYGPPEAGGCEGEARIDTTIDTIARFEAWLNGSDEKRPKRRMECGRWHCGRPGYWVELSWDVGERWREAIVGDGPTFVSALLNAFEEKDR